MTVVAGPEAVKPPAREIFVLADGIELVGEYEDSGFMEPPHLARRADGQVIQLTWLLYLVAEACDGRRDAEAIAATVSERFGRRVSARNVRFLAEERLRPLGVLALRDGTTPELPKREAMFALRCRKPIVPERAVNVIGAALVWLHWRPLKLVLLVALAGFDAWLFAVHGIAPALRSVIYDPAWLLAVLASTVAAAFWHECGHASACRYGGARPGVIGVGLYLVWPAFYCDVTDAYRLDRAGRLRTDLGGVYFNGIVALSVGAAYFATGHEALLMVAFVQHIVILQQLLPLLRFDGYYVLSDLTGVPDILSRIKPILRSLVRGRRNEPRVEELKPWVRVVVTAYLLALVPTLMLMLAWTLISAPRVLATVHDSFGLQFDRIGAASGFAEVALAVVRLVMLVLPVAAMSLSLGRSGRMAGRGLVGWSRGSVPRRVAAVTSVAALAGAVGYMWWPNGDYQPIRPGERGTIGETVMSIPDFAGGRPSFTKERERRFGPTSTVREQEQEQERRAHDDGAVDPSATPAPHDDGAMPRTPGAEPTDDPQDSPSVPSESAAPDPTNDPGGSLPAATPDAGSTPEPNAPAPAAEPSATATAEATPTPTAEPTATSTTTPSPASTQAPTPADAAPAESPAPTETAPAESPAPANAAPAESPAPVPTSTP